MSMSLRAAELEAPRKRFAKAALRGEAGSNFLADANLGPVIARTIAILGMNHDEFAEALGYERGGAVISRWTRNQEPPVLVRIWAHKVVRAAFVLALAQDAPGLEVE